MTKNKIQILKKLKINNDKEQKKKTPGVINII